MKTKSLWTILISFSIVLFVVFNIVLFARETQNPPLPVYGTVHNFMLTDSTGQPFELKQLHNDVWVADFIFTTCGGACPKMSANMAKLHRSYKLEKDVHFVSISVNPEQDTPELLAKYANRFDADTKSWHFLTGARDTITNLAVNSFMIGDEKEPIFHSTQFVLVDKKGNIRGYYDGLEEEGIRNLFRDMARVRRER